MKGIKSDVIESVLGEEVVDEEKMARELVEKKMHKWQGLEERVQKQKISQYLAGKGFSWDVIEKVLPKR